MPAGTGASGRAGPRLATSAVYLLLRLKVLALPPDTCCEMKAQRKTLNPKVDESSRSKTGMHTCPSCSSELVQPVRWFEHGEGQWHVDLRCPDCEWWGRGVYAQGEVDRYDEELDRGAQALMDDLRSVTQANMEDEADRFAAALATDCILPEDF